MTTQGKTHILIADAAGPERQVLEAVLGRLGYEVTTADSAAQLDQALASDRDFQVVILHSRLLGSNAADRARGMGTTTRRVILVSDDLPPGGEMMGFVDLTENALLALGVRVPEIVFAANDLVFSRKGAFRRKKRIYGGFGASYRTDGDWVTGGVYNLSSDGAFIETLDPPAVGTRLELKFELPGHGEVEFPCRVTWRVGASETAGRRSPPGVGVQFLDLTDETRGLLHDFVMGNRSR